MVTDRSVESSGFNIDHSLCNSFDSDGMSRGSPAAIVDHMDWGNVFVGQYNFGDIQYKGHISHGNSNLIYWKETKNFKDGCSAHMSGSYYSNGQLSLPDQATIIFEDTILDNLHVASNHHCNVGVTGFLCQPQYIFHNIRFNPPGWTDHWFSFGAGGGIYSLSPTSSTDFSPFPKGYVSLAHERFTALLSSPDCVSSSNDLGLGRRYSSGILCTKPLRAFKIYSRGLSKNGSLPPPVLVETWYNSSGISDHSTRLPSASMKIQYHQIGDTNKQGFSFPVMPTPDVSYRISWDGNDLPYDWVIEFSDPVVSNRWGEEFLQLDIMGSRSCGTDGLVSGLHDRRFLWNGVSFLPDQVWGKHGACAAAPAPDMPLATCPTSDSLVGRECPNECSEGCDVANSYCDCRTATCQCKAGFAGADCSVDLCSAARCGSHGKCVASYLGNDSTLPVTGSNACVCDHGWYGPFCDKPLNGGVTASATSSIQPASNAIDQISDTRWESSPLVDNVSFTLDIGKAVDIKELKINWANARAKEYRVLVSTDNILFTPVGGILRQGDQDVFTVTGLGDAYLDEPAKDPSGQNCAHEYGSGSSVGCSNSLFPNCLNHISNVQWGRYVYFLNCILLTCAL